MPFRSTAMRSCFFLGILLLSLQGNAQRFRAGLIAGLVASDVAGMDLYDFDNDFHKAGLTGGAFVNAKFTEKNSLQFEILYTQKGSWQPPVDSAHPDYYKLNLDYIEVPVIFRHKFHIQVKSVTTDRFALELGPSFGARIRIEQNGLFYKDGMFYSGYFKDDDFRKTELAFHIGICYNFYKNFMFDVRYSNSILPVTSRRDIFNNFFRYTFNKGDNMVFNFTLRYIFMKEEAKN